MTVVRLVVDQQVPITEVAARFKRLWPTVERWADRYRAWRIDAGPLLPPEDLPAPDLVEDEETDREARLRLREGPVRLAARFGVAPSTVYQTLRRCRLSTAPRATRCAATNIPGAVIHVDVKKLGNIPDGGGWRYVGRLQGDRNRAATPNRNATSTPTRRFLSRAGSDPGSW